MSLVLVFNYFLNIELKEEDLNHLLENAIEEEFYTCNIAIDGEIIENVGIRAKGNSSLMQISQLMVKNGDCILM